MPPLPINLKRIHNPDKEPIVRGTTEGIKVGLPREATVKFIKLESDLVLIEPEPEPNEPTLWEKIVTGIKSLLGLKITYVIHQTI